MGFFSRLRRGKASDISPDEPGENREPEFFSRELGETYPEFWDGMARSKEGAYLGVAGLPFGEPATEESLDRHGGQTAEVIVNKLELSKNDVVLEVGVGVGRLAKPIAPQFGHFLLFCLKLVSTGVIVGIASLGTFTVST